MTIRVMCAILFVAFSFLWLYFFQADLLTVAQNILSSGHTHYDRTIGALLITAVLWLLQLWFARMVKLTNACYALSYFPSMFLLAVLSSVNVNDSRILSVTAWPLTAIVLLLMGGGAVLAAAKVKIVDRRHAIGLLSRHTWINLLIMALMIVAVAATGNTNAVYQYRLRAETALKAGNYDEALSVGSRSLETDGYLMMLRMYAMSRKGVLGEQLFKYPLIASSDNILPTDNKAGMLYYPVDSLYRHLGAIPRHEMNPMDYLKTLFSTGKAKRPAADYLLCGYLIDKDLDSFAADIERFYTVNDSLPRYYREALVLYTHLRSHPVIVYHDAVLDVDYEDMQKQKSMYATQDEQRSRMIDTYADSYWFYYEYAGK